MKCKQPRPGFEVGLPNFAVTKTVVNAFSLIKRSCDLVKLQIIKVINSQPNSDQVYRCNVVNGRNVIIHGGFDKRVH